MKIFEFFRREKERKPVVLKDLTKFRLYRVDAWSTNASDEKIDAATLYVVAESSDDVSVQIRRFIRWDEASWTTAPVDVKIDDNAETVAAVATVLGNPPISRSFSLPRPPKNAARLSGVFDCFSSNIVNIAKNAFCLNAASFLNALSFSSCPSSRFPPLRPFCPVRPSDARSVPPSRLFATPGARPSPFAGRD